MKKLMIILATVCVLFSVNCATVNAAPPKVDVNIEKKDAPPKVDVNIEKKDSTPKVDVIIEKKGIPADKEKLHLYLLIGQSNMVGVGRVTEEDKKLHARVFNFNQAQKWVQAKDPLHGRHGVGMGLTFGKDIADSVDPSISIGLIPCAVGGTPLKRWVKGGDLYRKAFARAKEAMKKGVLKGIIWHQGESDSYNAQTAATYGTRLQQMIKDIRKDLGDEKLPFIVGELGHFCKQHRRFPHYVRVNQELNLIPSKVENTFCVSAKDLKNKRQGDVHFNTAGYHGLGHRYAKAMLKMIDKKHLTQATIKQMKKEAKEEADKKKKEKENAKEK